MTHITPEKLEDLRAQASLLCLLGIVGIGFGFGWRWAAVALTLDSAVTYLWALVLAVVVEE